MTASLGEQLVGTFRLTSLETRRADGHITHPYGDHPTGMFMFDRAGNFSVQVMEGRGSEHPARFIAMFGTYVVDDQRRTFTLTPLGSLDPTLIGGEVLRHVDLHDGLGVFHTDPQTVDGVETTTYITWRKVDR